MGLSEDRSVRALAPDGAMRRQRFSQEDAAFLVDRNIAVAKWNRTHTRILCIQFFGDLSIPATPLRWLRTGTRYSYRAGTETGSVWTHKHLPYAAMDAATGFVEPPEVLEAHMRALFQEVPLSILEQNPAPRLAPVVSIDAFRYRPAPRIAADLEEAA